MPGFGTATPLSGLVLAHRLRRERKVFDALAASPASPLSELVKYAYDDVPPEVHPLAERSLLAHLLKLEDEGRAFRSGERWSPAT